MPLSKLALHWLAPGWLTVVRFGVAAAILRALEDEARTLGLPLLRLETGDPLASAVRLYERAGFTRCGIFGDYRPNDSSVYMKKPLAEA